MEFNDDNNLDIHHIQQQQEEEDQEEAEEALSLSELPLSNDMSSKNNTTNSNRRSASEPPELFEFFSDLSSDHNMSSAEDIIFCGRLIPFREQSPPKFNFSKDFDEKPTSGFRRRSESLSELQSSGVSRSSSNTKARMVMRNSRSLDYQKLRRAWNTSAVSPALDIDRNSSTKSVGKRDVSPKKAGRVRWSSFLMFGTVKFPAEMELGDIKSRQARRNVPITTTLFPPMDSGGNLPVSRSNSSKSGGGGGGSWRLLKALSCKDHASVAVTASFYVPNV
ncbi:hypothetical protein L484_012849 [Morus notabilis]|uniref:Uncharacterized protein n=1 Tax=Morus notabilis TaxID=981085 RepID=W9R2S2_9ROSA|nr:uncharacterized protein LOC21396042 [Morus notabilis]EXB54749.1 hypothetical protein L484_012849 [Morus notabilis]